MPQALDLSIQAQAAPSLYYPSPSTARGSAKLYRPGGVTGGNGLTHCEVVPSDAPFTGGTITVYNNLPVTSGVGCVVIDAVCVAASTTLNDGFTPVGGSWAVVSGGPWVIPCGRYTYTDPFQTGPNFVPGFAKIPFTCTSLVRTDIPTAPPLLMFRMHTLNGQLTPSSPTSAQLTCQGTVYSGRRPWQAYYHAGNYVASNQAGIPTPTNGLIGALSIDFNTSVTTKTIMACGDSTQQGAKTTDSSANLHDFNGPIMVACDALSTLTRPVYAMNCGFQGQTTRQFMDAADMWLQANGPNIVIMQPWSVNDTNYSQTKAENSWERGRDILLKAKRSGIIPIWSTAYPTNSNSVGQDNQRIFINNLCRNDPVIGCIDYDAAVTAGGSPAQLNASYNSGDGTHCNNAGVAAIATNIQNYLTSNSLV